MSLFSHSPMLTYSLLVFFQCFVITHCASSMQPSCHDHERSSLLQFKQSMGVSKMASTSPSAYLKLESWEQKADCCSWDGVRCDEDTHHVVALSLGSSFLYGNIDSSSSLFQLVHLRSLDFSDNNFNGSNIPSAIGNLSRLSHLDLHFGEFSGQVPSEILELSKLVTLDLSENALQLQSPTLESLVEKLINLKHLSLRKVNILAKVPETLGNLSSLEYLSLWDCGLHGEFPVGVFQLPRLQFLSVTDNPQLSGYLSEFKNSSVLQELQLSNTSFFGTLPSSIGQLAKLEAMDLSVNNISGPIPSSLANLTQLTYLSLSYNNFARGNLSWLGKQTKLKDLSLGYTNLYGFFPSSLRNLTQLTSLSLSGNKITGQIPSWIANLTQLSLLDLGLNQLEGSIPPSIFSLVNLEILLLSGNNLRGSLNFESFQNLENLSMLQLSDIHLSMPSDTHSNITRLKLRNLKLSSCNLTEFPNFLRYQDELEILILSGNQIHGHIPKWLWNLSTEILTILDLSANFLIGFEEPPTVLPWSNLRQLALGGNMLRGAPPLPPPSTIEYSVSNNLLTGDISFICSLTSIVDLDLSSNNFSGVLPQCLGNLSRSLVFLLLRNNSFNGTIPQTCMEGSELKTIDFSHNQFRGEIPRSLVNCKMLQTLNLGNNQINDTFPSWLDVLPELGVLILRHNQLHDAIGKPQTHLSFAKLRIIDLSFNRFIGTLPSQHFQTWNAMKNADAEQLKYLQVIVSGYDWTIEDYDDITLTNKGQETEYEKIQELLAAIDLSSNRFEGSIPEDIANLKAIVILNLANNSVSGPIPSSLARMKNLESLDLSQNKLTGEIPQALNQLTFLGYFNVSSNHLEGPIPQGKQFSTFSNNSFESNLGLCGIPLSKQCGDSKAPAPPGTPSKQDQDEEFSPLGFSWKMVAIGYGSGFLIGIVIGQVFAKKKEKWLLNFYRMMQPKRREIRRL